MTRLPKYCGVVRTRDAEFRGFSELSSRARSNFLALIELTRSRRSKNNSIGDIEISLRRVLDQVGDQHFIVDLCTLDSQSNVQISDLLDPSGGFRSWVSFATSKLPQSAIPVAHLEDPFDDENFRLQLQGLVPKFRRIAVRVPSSYLDAASLGSCLRGALPSGTSFVALGDAGHVTRETKDAAIARVGEIFEAINSDKLSKFIPLSSSFPSSVVAPGYGQDSHGKLSLLEVEVSDTLINKFPFDDIIHGDYSSVFPEEFTGTVTNWVPRVDYALDDAILYFRVRRPDGGYIKCAKQMVRDPRFDRLPCWATRQILSAASGAPEGKSPAFWISVRVNSHIERQSRLRK